MQKLKFILISCFSPIISWGIDLSGYILTNAGDTIKGQIIYTPPHAKGKNGVYEVDTTMVWKVRFIKENGKKEPYKPNEIKGFGFKLNNNWHHYETILPLKGFGEIVRYSFFGRRVIDGTITGYIAIEGLAYFEFDKEKNLDWWFKTVGPGLNGFIHDLFSKKKNKLSQELKYFFKMDDNYLLTLPEKIDKSKVYEIIISYNEWKKTHL